MKVSIIVVALNAGEKLKETIQSILNQTYKDYEIVVKDGGSKDGSVEVLPKDERIKVFVEKDTGIYDAMNQAVAKAQGEYILFLNCGDSFYDNQVLERAADCIAREQDEVPMIVYGDTYGAKNDVMIAAPKKIDGFACYRNIPCHQSCFYAAQLCKEKPYLPEYRIRADYEHFLWCFYKAKAKMVYMGSTIATYEGGGYSESKENRKRDKEEHKLITEAYMEPGELKRYRRAMMLSMAPLRSFLAENKLTSGIYHWLKECLYHHKLRMIIGLLVMLVELWLFLGTGVMLEEVVNYHSGAGSWPAAVTQEAPVWQQEFVPQHKNLHLISFMMHKSDVTVPDGKVIISIVDAHKNEVFREERTLSDIKNGRFTDVEVDLTVDRGKTYYLRLESTPSSMGEYPMIGVCGTEYELPENRELVHGTQLPDVQLVSRYHYVDALSSSRIMSIFGICVFTGLGIMFGLPKNRCFRKIVGFILFLVMPYVLGQRMEMLLYNELHVLPKVLRFRELHDMTTVLKWNVGIMYGLEILVLLCIHSPGFAAVITNIVLGLLYSANYFVMIYRGTPLRANDFTAVGTATQVMGDYSFVPNDSLAIIWGLLFLFVVFGVQTGTWSLEKKRKGRRLWRAISYVVTIALAIGLGTYGGYKMLYTDYFTQAGLADEEYRGFYQDVIYYLDGYLVGSCIEIRNSRITPMEGYSYEYVEEVLQEYVVEQEPAEDLPHVILVMNESFSDLRILGDLELNQENMSFFYSLEENTVRGNVNASVIGGGTANTEFEVFTGCSMAFFAPNYYPYQQAIKAPLNSFISQMEKYGYTTYSMHPEPSGNWNRDNVYRYYGFDDSFYQHDFENAERIHSGVSDAATYDKVIELYENRKEGEKLFVFDLTMQNHGSYNQRKVPYDVVATNIDEPQINEYLSLVKISDEALKDLIGYFEKQDEKVIICMFGDHQPWISDMLVSNDASMGEVLNKYKTPFMIWANYDIEEADGYDISMNYLGGLLQRTAGIPLSPYFTYLEQLREEYPIITANGYIDATGMYHNWSSEGKEFPEYRMIQYNYLFDDDTVEWGY